MHSFGPLLTGPVDHSLSCFGLRSGIFHSIFHSTVMQLTCHLSDIMSCNFREPCIAYSPDSCAAKGAFSPPLFSLRRPRLHEKETPTELPGTGLNNFRIHAFERFLYRLRILISRALATFMDSLCQPCRRLLGLEHEQDRAQRRNQAYINFKSWSDNALNDSCHLCTLLFHSAAGRNYQQFITSYTAATYELGGYGLGTPNITDIIDENEGNFKYLAIVERVRPDSHKSRITCISA